MSAGVSDAEMALILAGLNPVRIGGDDPEPARVVTPAPEIPRDGQPITAPVATTCCRCGEPLERELRWLGEHPSCESAFAYRPPRAVETIAAPALEAPRPPQSTIAELRSVLVDFEANRPRSKQTTVGPSEIAVPCDRRLAYSLARTPKLGDGRVKWAPMIGSACHAMIAEALAEENTRLGRERWLIEQRVHADDEVSGESDAYDVDTATVIDWKVVGPTRLQHYRRHGPGPQYEGQIQVYGLGWHNAGHAPAWVRIVFLPRDTDFDKAYEWTVPYSRETALAVLARMNAIRQLLVDVDYPFTPDRIAEIAALPNKECSWCPWHRRGAPADATGCPGDVAADVAAVTKATAGIIPA